MGEPELIPLRTSVGSREVIQGYEKPKEVDFMEVEGEVECPYCYRTFEATLNVEFDDFRLDLD